MGSEAAGVVLETGPGVTGLAVGDRVMGMAPGGFGPVAVADARLLARIPGGLVVRAGGGGAGGVPDGVLRAARPGRAAAGRAVLVHAAAGGVGMAAVQLARHWARRCSPPRARPSGTLCGAGCRRRPHRLLARHRVRGGVPCRHRRRGVDVVLNSLAGEFVDASLRLLAPGGRFVEMGKTDIRDPDGRRGAPGRAYRAFDLARRARTGSRRCWPSWSALFGGGVLQPLPVTVLGRAAGARRRSGS